MNFMDMLFMHKLAHQRPKISNLFDRLFNPSSRYDPDANFLDLPDKLSNPGEAQQFLNRNIMEGYVDAIRRKQSVLMEALGAQPVLKALADAEKNFNPFSKKLFGKLPGLDGP